MIIINLVCPFCQDYPDPVDFSDTNTKGVFMSTNQPDLIKHIYDIHDDLTLKQIIKKLCYF